MVKGSNGRGPAPPFACLRSPHSPSGPLSFLNLQHVNKTLIFCPEFPSRVRLVAIERAGIPHQPPISKVPMIFFRFHRSFEIGFSGFLGWVGT